MTEKQEPEKQESKDENNALASASTDELATPIYVTITQEELEKLENDAEEYKDKYLRLLAEMDNLRKRMNKERQELIQMALQQIIVEFLNPIDHLENALKYAQQASDEVRNWALGFQMIQQQFKDVLSDNGVVPFTAIGTTFDPHHHEAIDTTVTQDHPPGTVLSESLRGYKMGERTIRPARVTVAKASE